MAQLYWRVKRDGKWVMQAVFFDWSNILDNPECECLRCSNKGVEAFE